MNAYNPLDSLRRLEASGLPREQAEAIAGELNDVGRDLVTVEGLKQQLDSLDSRLDTKLTSLESRLDAKMDAALNRQLVRVGVLFAALLTLACTVLNALK